MPATDPVQAVMKVLGCEKHRDLNGTAFCGEHRFGWLRDVNACPRAERAAEVAVEAARPLIAAEVATERDDLPQRLSALLCDLTNGLMSKTNYDVQTMVQEVEAAFSEAFQSERQTIAAQALAEAADDLGGLVDNQHPAALNPDQWLRDRAARIEREGQS